MATTSDEARAMGDVTQRLRARFPQADPDQIHALVGKVHRQYDGRPIREFVPMLVEREVADAVRMPRSA